MNWLSRAWGRVAKRAQRGGTINDGATGTAESHAVKVRADNPIRKAEDDVLGRAKTARSFAAQVLSLDVSEGVVVGVLGPWGSGKTSFVNLARPHLEAGGATVLDFNPWMFSGAEHLIDSFFAELSAQLKLRPDLAEVGQDLEEYGEIFSGLIWIPVVGPFLERVRAALKALGRVFRRRKGGMHSRRTKVEKALVGLDKPIVVVIDDIDRLTTAEIRDIFKLVRLTASFPNVLYVVAFDRARVEQALGEQGIPGRDYLEKILQVGVDLPAVPSQVLNREVFRAIDAALNTIENPGRFDEDAWPDVFMEVIRPLVRNVRDVRRFAAAIAGTSRDLDGQIALVDVLGLEAVRVFLPDVFCAMHGSVSALISTSDIGYGGRQDESHAKSQVDRLIEAAGGHGDVVRALIKRLFPAAQRHVGGSHYGNDWKATWLRDRRVAHEDLLRLYLERTVGEGLQAFTDAERAWGLLHDREALDTYLRSLEVERLEDVISSLEAYESQFRHEHVVPACIVLLNLLPELPERDRGMFSLGRSMVVGRVAYLLVRSLKDLAAIERAVQEILPEVTTLYGKHELVTIVGHRERASQGLISKEAAIKLEKDWREEVRAASPGDLLREPDLLKVLYRAVKDADPAEPTIAITDSPQMTRALLKSGRSETRSQVMGNRAVRRSPRLAWDVLVELYGGASILAERIAALKAANLEGSDDLISLAERYIAGWRPE